nr:hypothetical protein CFP56_25823 [Quercus suber]
MKKSSGGQEMGYSRDFALSRVGRRDRATRFLSTPQTARLWGTFHGPTSSRPLLLLRGTVRPDDTNSSSFCRSPLHWTLTWPAREGAENELESRPMANTLDVEPYTLRSLLGQPPRRQNQATSARDLQYLVDQLGRGPNSL